MGPFFTVYGCIVVWTHGTLSSYHRWFARAISVRKGVHPELEGFNIDYHIFMYPDMDYGGVQFAHALSNDKFGQWGACNAEYGFSLKSKWLFQYPSYLQFRFGFPNLPGHFGGTVFKRMTLSNRQRELIDTYQNNHPQVINNAGNGNRRRENIEDWLNDLENVRLNVDQVNVLTRINLIDDMIYAAINEDDDDDSDYSLSESDDDDDDDDMDLDSYESEDESDAE